MPHIFEINQRNILVLKLDLQNLKLNFWTVELQQTEKKNGKIKKKKNCEVLEFMELEFLEKIQVELEFYIWNSIFRKLSLKIEAFS